MPAVLPSEFVFLGFCLKVTSGLRPFWSSSVWTYRCNVLFFGGNLWFAHQVVWFMAVDFLGIVDAFPHVLSLSFCWVFLRFFGLCRGLATSYSGLGCPCLFGCLLMLWLRLRCSFSCPGLELLLWTSGLSL